MAPGINFLKRFRGIYKSIEELQRLSKETNERLDKLEEHPMFKRVTVCDLCPYEYGSPGCLATPCFNRNFLENKSDYCIQKIGEE